MSCRSFAKTWSMKALKTGGPNGTIGGSILPKALSIDVLIFLTLHQLFLRLLTINFLINFFCLFPINFLILHQLFLCLLKY